MVSGKFHLLILLAWIFLSQGADLEPSGMQLQRGLESLLEQD